MDSRVMYDGGRGMIWVTVRGRKGERRAEGVVFAEGMARRLELEALACSCRG